MTHEEAIKIVKLNWPEGRHQIKEALETLIPELTESEDERIRKGLLNIFKESQNGHWAGMEIKDIVAWLEKQKAKEKYDRMAPIYEDKESFESALDKAWKFYDESGSSTVDGCEDNSMELAFAKGFREGFLYKEQEEPENVSATTMIPSWWTEKQKGTEVQKYSLKQAAEIFLDALSDTPYNNKPITDAQVITRELLKFLSDAHSYNPDALCEQKPAEWSEEDLQHKSWILECLADGERTMPEYAEDFHAAYNWLKDLPNRFAIQPRRDCGDVDYKAIKLIEDVIRVYGKTQGEWIGGYDMDALVANLNRLKSLRPQPHWKPSEEQIKALDKAIPVCMGVAGKEEVAPLESLYNDLKKLL